MAVAKASKEEHIKENSAAMDFNLEKEDIETINELNSVECRHIPLLRIRIDRHYKGKRIYATVEEALKNELDLIPSPETMAKRILKNKIIKPIRVVMTKDTNQNWDYELDSYDLMDQVKKYWGWVIAFGPHKDIPAYLLGTDS